MKRIAIFGGTGFVGHYLLESLRSSGYGATTLVRPGSEHKLGDAGDITQIRGDLSESQAIERVLTRADTVIYNVGILREFPNHGISFGALHYEGVKRVVEKTQQAGIRRFILMSANGVKQDGVPYQKTKYAAEALLRESGLQWTIFRPSVLFGNPRGRLEFATQLFHDVIRPPLPAPLFFDGWNPGRAGQLLMAPAHVEDVANAFVQALERADTFGKIIDLCGPEALSWKEILQRIAHATNRHKLMIPAPTGPISLLAKVFDRYPWFPLTADQISMLMQGNTCADNGFSLFDIKPRKFDNSSLAYLSRQA